MKKNKIYRIMLFFCICVSLGCNTESPIETEGAEVLERTEDKEETEEAEASEKQIYVQVSGAVMVPGVYEMPEGSRVFEVIEMAGGIADDADADGINQAQILADGQMIYIMHQGECSEMTDMQQEDGRVNLNTATREQLMTLPGIGKAKADSIISWREKNGGFTRIEDLMKIEGIKEGVFSKIKDSIKVN